MFNKPAGCITAKSDDKHPVIMDYFKELNNDKLNPVGRLDIDTEGLIFITDDGMWNHRLMKPEFHVEKTYFFWVLGDFNEGCAEELKNGVYMKGMEKKSMAKYAKTGEAMTLDNLPEYAKGKRYEVVKRNPKDSVITSGYITLTEGKKRQVKRMLKAVGCYVIYLKRINIGGVELDEELELGEYRELTEEEMKKLL